MSTRYRVNHLALRLATLLATTFAALGQSVTLLPNAVPGAASPNGAVVSILGTGFPTTPLTPAAVEVRLTPAATPGAPPVVIQPDSIAITFQSQRQITFRIPDSLNLPDSAAYQVTIGGSGLTTTNSALLIVNPPAAIQSLSQASAQANQSPTVTITGRFTNFTSGVTTASFGPGVRVGGAAAGEFGPITVTSPTTASASIAVDSTATPGPRTVSARTGVEVASIAAAFSVTGGTPVITSVAPNSGLQGTSALEVTLNGQFTNWTTASTVSFGPGITVTNVNRVSATQLIATINIALLAAIGPRDVVVTTGTQVVTRTGAFQVNLGPKITQVSPNTGQRGVTNLAVQITGEATAWAQASTSVSFGAGITVGTVTVTSPTLLTASISIATDAALGARTVTVTTGTSVQTLAAFEVQAISGRVSGVISRLGGTPAGGAQVRIYSANPFVLLQTAAASPIGEYTFDTIPAGNFRLYAVDSSSIGQIAYQAGALTLPGQQVAANLTLSGTGTLTVEVKDILGTPVRDAGVSIEFRNVPTPPELNSVFTRVGSTDMNGRLELLNFPTLPVQVTAVHPVNSSSGVAVGQVPVNGTLTVPVTLNATGFNETNTALISLRNGPPPSTTFPPGSGFNDISTALISLRNGPEPSATFPPGSGFNDVSTALISLRNGPEPGPTFPAGSGFNDVSTALISLRNGPPVLTLPAGQTETFALPLVLRNGDGPLMPALLTEQLGDPANFEASTGASGEPRTALRGETVTLRYADEPEVGSVEFFLNGASLGELQRPFETAFVVPETVNALTVRAVVKTPTGVLLANLEQPWTVLDVAPRNVRVVVAGAKKPELSVTQPGLLAEFFDFNQTLTSIPKLDGLRAARTISVSSLNFRNPDAIFRPEPFGTGFAPDFAIRFSGFLTVEEAGEYRFALRAKDGATLRIGEQDVREGAAMRLTAGRHPIRLDYYEGVGEAELQVLWARDGAPLRPVPADRWTHDLAATADAEGTVQLSDVPAWMTRVTISSRDRSSAQEGAVELTRGETATILKSREN